MPDLQVQMIDVLYLRRHGHLIAYGLSEDEVYSIAPSLRNDPDKEIVTVAERVGTVHGEVHDWSKHGGFSRNPKLHWFCPRCGQQWHEDFVGAVKNPTFRDSGCNCVPYWLVHWNPKQVNDELALAKG